jgi:hypothetical protein
VAGTDVTINLATVVMLPSLVWPVSIDTGFGLGDCGPEVQTQLPPFEIALASHFGFHPDRGSGRRDWGRAVPAVYVDRSNPEQRCVVGVVEEVYRGRL